MKRTRINITEGDSFREDLKAVWAGIRIFVWGFAIFVAYLRFMEVTT